MIAHFLSELEAFRDRQDSSSFGDLTTSCSFCTANNTAAGCRLSLHHWIVKITLITLTGPPSHSLLVKPIPASRNWASLLL